MEQDVAYVRKYKLSGAHEVPLSQCDRCGSEVLPEDIDWDMRYTHKDIIISMLAGGILVAVGFAVFNWIW